MLTLQPSEDVRKESFRNRTNAWQRQTIPNRTEGQIMRTEVTEGARQLFGWDKLFSKFRGISRLVTLGIIPTPITLSCVLSQAHHNSQAADKPLAGLDGRSPVARNVASFICRIVTETWNASLDC